MRHFALACVLAILLPAGALLLAEPARADAVNDEPVPGLEPARRAPPEAEAPAPPPAETPPAPAPQVSAPPPPAVAASAPPPPAAPGWHFTVAPYLWIPETRGTQTLSGLSSDIDMSFKDVIENFDVSALALRTEAHRDRFGFFLDTYWQDIDGDFGSRQSLRVQTELEQVRVDFGAFWHALEFPAGDTRIAVSPYAGGRFSWLKQIVRLNVPGAGRSLGDRENWWEPLVGTRVVWKISPPFSILVQGDAGGFGLGSDLTWQAAGAFQYRFTNWFTLNLGYYVYDVDYSTGSGRNRFGYSIRQQGPRIGLQFNL